MMSGPRTVREYCQINCAGGFIFVESTDTLTVREDATAIAKGTAPDILQDIMVGINSHSSNI
ncbi:uncharacterized protein N7518_009500 [Penicillium psychrosexuale]|uniref:uncharacterized protein n=1 Tax=Penicillium psychrosexuale TaxID=1002107 RepID=UPI0025452CF1|nr:uncharacterized protein N7518_009500 [Penicillium psychrosexuale]KAJ5783823.1 hypothetical protein N7518_009500 [Penicillium psychrosexuale]